MSRCTHGGHAHDRGQTPWRKITSFAPCCVGGGNAGALACSSTLNASVAETVAGACAFRSWPRRSYHLEPGSGDCQCKAGIVGSFPALTPAKADGRAMLLGKRMAQADPNRGVGTRHNSPTPIFPAAPLCGQPIVHALETRGWSGNIEICPQRKVPIWIQPAWCAGEVNDRPNIAALSRCK